MTNNSQQSSAERARLSIIVPCYNEEEVLPHSFERLWSVREALERAEPLEVDLLFVNDGSQDRTAELLDGYAEAHPERVRVLHFSRNFGHQAAITAGMNACDADYALLIDADMQDPPEVIPEMWRVMQEEQVAVVYGVRSKREGETWFKKASAKWFYRLLNRLTDYPIPVDSGDFRLVNREVLDCFRQLPEHNKYIRGIISWMGFPQKAYYYERHERYAGETKYSAKKMIRLATDAVQYFSTKPLKLAMRLGFFSVCIGLLLGLWVLFGKIFGFTYPESGWSSIMIAIIFFGGIQLITIGVLGRYVGVIFDEVKQRPEYIIAKRKNFQDESNDERDKRENESNIHH